MTIRRRAKIGDVLELTTPAGLAYLQYTHRHPRYGALIRVLPELYRKRPADVGTLAQQRERFVVFFPVGAATSRDIITIAGHADIPAHARTFPLFKTGWPNNWWLWDGEREWRVGDLTAEQLRLPTRGIWNDTMLASRIVNGWSPEDDPRERTDTRFHPVRKYDRSSARYCTASATCAV